MVMDNLGKGYANVVKLFTSAKDIQMHSGFHKDVCRRSNKQPCCLYHCNPLQYTSADSIAAFLNGFSK